MSSKPEKDNGFTAIEEMSGEDITEIINQGEAERLQEFVSQAPPRNFNDLVNAIALSQPKLFGSELSSEYISRFNGDEKFEYGDVDLKPILENTLGLYVYREQVVRTCCECANFTLEETDSMIQAMAKGKQDEIEYYRDYFIDKMSNGGYAKHFAQDLFERLKRCNEHGMLKGHVAPYARQAIEKE